MITPKGYFFLSYLVTSLVFQTYSESISLPFFKAEFWGRDVWSVNYEAPLVPIRQRFYALRPSRFVGESSLIVDESSFFATSACLIRHRIFMISTSFYFTLWWVLVSVTSPFVTHWRIIVILSLSYALCWRIFVGEPSSPTNLRTRRFAHNSSPTKVRGCSWECDYSCKKGKGRR